MWPLYFLWEGGLWNLATLLGILIFVLISLNLLNPKLFDQNIPIRDTTKTHNWQTRRNFLSCFCSVCEYFLVKNEGFYCDVCSIYADMGCLKKANSILKCKEISIRGQESMKHLWVKGNLPEGCACYKCNEECLSEEHSLTDYQCAWCFKCAHTDCLSDDLEDCDLGTNRNFIIPPIHVVLSYKRSRVGWKLRLKSITDPVINDWTPVFVLGNRKSGNNSGGDILSGFRRILNPLQVVDLCDMPPSSLSEWLHLLPETCTPILLVAGGDGTASWVLTAVQSMKMKTDVPVALIPLGTGNDLSRVLGWGKEEPKLFSAQEILDSVQRAKPVDLDRWNVVVSPVRHFGHFSRTSKSHFMYNYMSVGVDAQVALDFHRTRQSPFYIVSSRIFNKMLYLLFGTQQVMERGCRNLEQRLELYLDEERIELPPVESIVILNIPSWGAGVHLWNVGRDPKENLPEQSFNDGKLEVVGIYSSFHIAQLQVGLSQPLRIGQAKSVRIKLKGKSPVQIDGEPWVQHPSDILVTFEGRAKVLQSESF